MNALQRAVEWVAARALPVLSSLRYSGRNGGWYPWIHEPFTGAWQRNVEINRESVLAHHAVFACVTLIANDIAKLRPKLVEQDDDGIWAEVKGASPFWPVLRKPNRYQNRIQFLAWWITSKLTCGNTYILLEREPNRGIVRAMYCLDPNRVQVLVSEDGEVFYKLNNDNLSGLTEEVTVPADAIIHDRWNCLFHPLVGLSPIYANGLSAHVGLTIQQNVAAFFANGSSPSGVLTAPGQIHPEQAEVIKHRWETLFSGQNSGRVAVLGNDLKYQPLRMSAVDSQMLEFTKASAEQICSTFHVPQFKVGLGQMPTYQNGEILNGIYYSDCLQALIEQLELCMDEGLGLDERKEDRTLGVELDLDALLRMDVGSQMDALAKGVGAGIIAPNEARKKLDHKPKLGGESPYLQQQNYSIAALARRDAAEPVPPTTPDEPLVITPPNDAPDDAGERVLSFARRVNRRARTLRLRAA